MNFSDFTGDNGRRIAKDHFIHLLQVSRADGHVNPSELAILHREGRKFGLTPPEVDKLIEHEGKHQYDPPYALSEKFEHLYKVAEMILADNEATEDEKRLMKRFAIEAGFSDKSIPKLIDMLIEGVRKGDDEEILLQEFRNKYLFKE
jgi:uncharacterized tellurite resistance protein B-like protein